MSTDQPKNNVTNQAAQEALPGNASFKTQQSQESALLKLYIEVTGEDESQARSAFMFAIPDNEESGTRRPN